jgi:hypothetical protein
MPFSLKTETNLSASQRTAIYVTPFAAKQLSRQVIERIAQKNINNANEPSQHLQILDN